MRKKNVFYLFFLLILFESCEKDNELLNRTFQVLDIETFEPTFYNYHGKLDSNSWIFGKKYLSFLSGDDWGIKTISIESEAVAYVNDTVRYKIDKSNNQIVLRREILLNMQSADQYFAVLSNEQTENPHLSFIYNDCYADSIVLSGTLSDFNIVFYTYELKYNNDKTIIGNESGILETTDKLLVGDKFGEFDEKYLIYLDENDTIGIVKKIMNFN